MTIRISVFGGSSPEPGSKPYQDAYELGKSLGQAGVTVLTGGYMGTMEATSRGASEAGGHVIGVTCDEIESFRPVGPNPWVKEEWRRKTLRERLATLIENCDAAIALPGGVGTLLEISLYWNEVTIHVLEPKPLILMGPQWRRVMETFFEELGDYVALVNREYIAYAPQPNTTLELLENFLNLTQN
jgi:uncharacterized protein (TIGR00725 family)